MILRALDFECTGLDPAKDGAEVIEIGYVDITGDDWTIGVPQSILVRPTRPIPAIASAVHHLTDADVAGAQPFSVAALPLLEQAADTVLCAHFAKYEKQFFTVPARWVCTWKVAIHLAPKAPGHKLQELRYFLKLDVDKKLAEPPHRAAPDAYVCAALVKRMLAKLTVQQMIEISSRPAILPCFIFGKHAMKPIEEIDDGYLRWVLENIPDDEDVRATAAHHLQMRRK